MDESKVCTGCGECKAIAAFGIVRKNWDGRNEKCRSCCNERAKHVVHSPAALARAELARMRWRERNPEYGRAYRQSRRGRERMARGQRVFKAREQARWLLEQTSTSARIGFCSVDHCYEWLRLVFSGSNIIFEDSTTLE